MIRMPPSVILLAALLVAAAPVWAETHPLDDSASQVFGRAVRMKHDILGTRGFDSTATGRFTVLARIDVSPWKGRNGQVYLRMPSHPLGKLVASWTSRGRLLPGRVQNGGRALVYAGPIESDRLEDMLQFTLEADGQQLDRNETLEFVFEIDPLTP